MKIGTPNHCSTPVTVQLNYMETAKTSRIIFFLFVHYLNTVSLLTRLTFQSIIRLQQSPWSLFYDSLKKMIRVQEELSCGCSVRSHMLYYIVLGYKNRLRVSSYILLSTQVLSKITQSVHYMRLLYRYRLYTICFLYEVINILQGKFLFHLLSAPLR